MRAAAVMMHGLPSNVRPSSRQSAACPSIYEGREWTEAPPAQVEQPQYPQPEYRTPASICNLDIQSRSNLPGPMASFLPQESCAMLLQCSPRKIQAMRTSQSRELQREASLENVAAGQRYLEKLQFELNTLRLWSNGIQDEIMDEAQKLHLQLMKLIRELQRLNNALPWVEGWQVTSSQAPPSQAPAQSSAPSSSIPAKSAPAPRTQQSQPSSVASAPRNPRFPSELAQLGANPRQRLNRTRSESKVLTVN